MNRFNDSFWGMAPWWTDNTLAPVRVPGWQLEAACRGAEYPDDWYADYGTPEAIIAEAVCQTCPVRTTCMAQGLQEKHGVWGGVHLEPPRPMPTTCNKGLHAWPENRAERFSKGKLRGECRPCRIVAQAARRHRKREERARERDLSAIRTAEQG